MGCSAANAARVFHRNGPRRFDTVFGDSKPFTLSASSSCNAPNIFRKWGICRVLRRKQHSRKRAFEMAIGRCAMNELDPVMSIGHVANRQGANFEAAAEFRGRVAPHLGVVN